MSVNTKRPQPQDRTVSGCRQQLQVAVDRDPHPTAFEWDEHVGPGVVKAERGATGARGSVEVDCKELAHQLSRSDRSRSGSWYDRRG